MRELRPFCINPLVAPLAFSHQLSKEVSEGCGDKEWRPACLRRRYQNCLAKTQETRRWLIVILLVTERALLRMRQPTTRKAICRPAPIVGHQPKEKTAFGRCPGVPDPLIWSKLSRSQEETLIGRLG